MKSQEQLLEFDYSPNKRGKKFLLILITYLIILVSFNVLSSYKNPTIRNQNQLIDIFDYTLQTNIETEIFSINLDLVYDSTQNIDNHIKKLMVDFYQKRNYQPVWIEHVNTNNNFNTLINLLDSSAYFGFPFDYFNIMQIHQLKALCSHSENNLNTEKQLLDLELTSSYSALKLMLYLKNGIVEKDTSIAYLNFSDELPEILNQSLRNHNLRKEILAVQPNLVNHRNLLKSLSFFIDLNYSVKYTTPSFIDDKLLAKSLYYAEITKSPKFDSTNLKADALYKLESQYGLPHDSILNVPTHQVIVSLLQYKYYLACLNINRLRKLKYTGENYLFVNIPEFKLHVIESNTEKEAFNVIVGKEKTPTPVLSSSIEKVIANPYWTVPKSIVNNEMLNKIRRDSTYLKRNGFFIINWREEIVDESEINWNNSDPLGNKYWLRQINSKSNALGQVKFIFPNNYSVYLHDTPSKRLFNEEKRAYSHGCIRLENPDKLAQYLTQKDNSRLENFNNLLSTSERQVIDLSKKVDIHIQYITCSTFEDNDLVFYNDIYKLDQDELKVVFPDLFEI